MKEQFVPIEPIKKGMRVTAISGKVAVEALRPRIEPQMRRSIAELLNALVGSK